ADTVNKLKDGESVLLDSEKLTSLKTIAPNEAAKYFCLFPLRVENELEGTLLAVSSSESPFTKERVRTVSSLVDQVAVAVHRSSLYERLYRSYAQTTKAIARAIDAKDPYNQGHSEGVAGIAVKIARSMGLSTDQVRGIEIAAYLHDVGKIGISEDILKKPAQLSEEERDQVRQHPAIGVTILGPIEFPWPVLPAVQSHHENYGGNGYPDKLAGEDIPLEARILAVADAYESMISDRPYRSALETEEIIKEFARESGRQFDARVVSALLDVIESEMVEKKEAVETEEGRQEIAFEAEAYRAETAEPDIILDKQAADEPTADKPAEELLEGKAPEPVSAKAPQSASRDEARDLTEPKPQTKKPAGKKRSKRQKSKESS
ncbi:MAG: HD domain-containing phosphohydrolase, partial [Actinomycetota bacterium]